MLDPIDATGSATKHPLLLVGPAGGGKTAACLKRVRELHQDNPLARTWVVVPTWEQRSAFSRRLVNGEVPGRAAIFGVEPMEFSDLCRRIVDSIDVPPRRVRPPARLYLLRRALDDVVGRAPLDHFSSIAHGRGFADEVLKLIDELQSSGISAEDFAGVARSRAEHDLGRIYAAYQSLLRSKDLRDHSSLGQAAIEALDKYPSLGARIDLLVVDGFDRLGRAQIAVLERLAGRARMALFTLTYSPERAVEAHRRFAPTFDALATQIGCKVQEIDVDRPMTSCTRVTPPASNVRVALRGRPEEGRGNPYATCPDARVAALVHLEAHLFALGTKETVPAAGAVALLEAPDPPREVQQVGRRIKRLLLDSARPEDVVVLTRSLETYGPLCREVFEDFGIPVAVAGGTPLATNPAVATLMALLELAQEEFPRAGVVDLLRSPYVRFRSPQLTEELSRTADAGADISVRTGNGVGPTTAQDAPTTMHTVLTPEQVDLLDRVSRERVVVRGREQWLNALTSYRPDVRPSSTENAPDLNADLEDAAVPPSVLDGLSVEQIESLRAGLESFFVRITPPVEGSARHFVRWLEGLIGADPEERGRREKEAEPSPEEGGGFDIVAQARTGPAKLSARDISALCSLKTVLAAILAGSELADPAKVFSWTEFHQDLLSAVERKTYEPDSERAGRVLVAEARSQRGVPRDHLFLLGMAEGIFPRRPPEDPLFSRTDRQSLASGGLDLDLADASEEMSLFYEITALPRKSLTLSRPYLDETGNPWPASPYVREVERLLSDVEQVVTRLSHLPPPGEAASLSELCLSVGAGLLSDRSVREPAARWLANREETARAWAASCRGKTIERLRQGKSERGAYQGVLVDPRFVEIVARRLGERHVWSATQFNEYAQCPFHFFAKRMLGLELVQEPEEGISQLHLGAINHRILELTYRRLTDEGIGLTREELLRIRAFFDEVAEEVLASAPRAMGFRPAAWWRHEREGIRRRLWRLIEADAVDNGGAQLLRQEARFGFGEPGGPALVLDGPAGRLRVRGQIDRIDRTGGGYRVIDYKSGSTGIRAEDQASGRHTQMQIYLLAAAELLKHWGLPNGPLKGFFWHVRSGNRSGELALGDGRVESTVKIIHQNVSECRRAHFPVQPGKFERGKCGGSCDYGNLCRFSASFLK